MCRTMLADKQASTGTRGNLYNPSREGAILQYIDLA